MKANLFFLPAAIVAAGMYLTSCSPQENDNTGTMSVKIADTEKSMQKDLSLLTDVILDVQEVNIHYGDDTSAAGPGWISLPTNVGYYNLMDIDTDATAVLVSDLDIPAGKVTQMRLVLGNNNSVIVDSVVYPLKVPSGSQSGLKINLKEDISFSTAIEVLLDFDPYHSVIENPNGYMLKPVIKVDVVHQH